MKKRQGKKPGKVPRTTMRSETKRKKLHIDELKAILERAKPALSSEDHEKLASAVDTLAFLTAELEAKGASIRRLRRLIFGSGTEKTSQVVGQGAEGDTNDPAGSDDATTANGETGAGTSTEVDSENAKSDDTKKKRKGHGRNSAASYTGATKVKVAHGSLNHGDPCPDPDCQGGKVYRLSKPKMLVRVMGMAPLSATVYELEQLRCHLCGKVFTAEAPEEVGEQKYDETAAAMIALLKYGTGLPFNRLERLEGSLGIPLPASTQWEVVKRAANLIKPVYDELVKQAAQGKLLHNDDTTMKILDLEKPAEKAEEAEEAEGAEKASSKERTGVFTSGIVSVDDDHLIALFLTGHKHAGENLADVLAQRAQTLPPPIQMCDALSRNTVGGDAGEFETILANCNAHARRKYVDVVESFPDEVRHVLETLRDVYRFDKEAKVRGMSPEERLSYHQTNSGPLMAKLKVWLREQFDEKKVEPNSSLGQAIKYMLKHWEKLTLFLSVAGAPLDNNICERALKKAILHRKNAMFYKTENGARVGDMFMSFIYSCELNGINPFDYLVELMRHPKEISESPSDWMPWNYQATLDQFASRPS